MSAIYGLASCDACRKARRAIPDARFCDLRTMDGLAAKLPGWHAAAGGRLLNKASTTWRALDDRARARAETDLLGLLAEHPALVKRPVIEADGQILVGWTPEVRARFGA